MKKYLFSLFSLFVTTMLIGQVAPNKYWVKFTDKNGSPYSIDDPAAFLTQRAIDRRTAHGIAIDESDIPVNQAYVDAVEAIGVTILNTSKWFNSVTIYTTNSSLINTINNLDFVESVEKGNSKPNMLNDKFYKPFFNNESYGKIPETGILKSSNSGLSYDYGDSFNQINMLNGVALHDLGYDGEGMVIAVLDAGYLNVNDLPAFDNLWNNGQILGTRDFVAPHNPDIFNSHSHGCMVLSTMGGYLPGEIIGTAPQADYWLLRSEDGDSEYLIEELNWVSAAEFADSVGADVINSSLGYTTFDNPSQDHSYEDMDGNTTPITIGADKAASKGMIVVNSAGNSGNDPWHYIGAPADGDSVFTIGAVNGNGEYASFSSVGPTYDGQVKPNVVAQGQGSTIVEPWGGTVTNGNGTSFSSPITAGMVACLWQAHPEKRNTEIMQAIQLSATQANTPDDLLGYGIPDYMLAHDIITNSGIEYSVDNSISIFPNPFNDEIFITSDIERKGPVNILLLDVAGKILHQVTLNNIVNGEEILLSDLGKLKPGVYFTKINYDNYSSVKKIVKK
ncbi:MAG: S8 family serine peptidase [Bacteroidales bacterium]